MPNQKFDLLEEKFQNGNPSSITSDSHDRLWNTLYRPYNNFDKNAAEERLEFFYVFDFDDIYNLSSIYIRFQVEITSNSRLRCSATYDDERTRRREAKYTSDTRRIWPIRVELFALNFEEYFRVFLAILTNRLFPFLACNPFTRVLGNSSGWRGAASTGRRTHRRSQSSQPVH